MVRITWSVRMEVATLAIAWLLGSTLALRPASAQDGGKTSADGKAFWEHVLHLVDQYDPAVADLYADDAVLKNVFVDANGKKRETSMEPARFKALLRAQLPPLRGSGRHSVYSACTYAPVVQGLRIECERRPGPQEPAHHVSVLVSRDVRGRWQIREEISTIREPNRPSR
jgi:hypothetical protein